VIKISQSTKNYRNVTAKKTASGYGIRNLISNQKVLIYTTHIKKVMAKLYSFPPNSKTTDKQYKFWNFAKVRNSAWHQLPRLVWERYSPPEFLAEAMNVTFFNQKK